MSTIYVLYATLKLLMGPGPQFGNYYVLVVSGMLLCRAQGWKAETSASIYIKHADT
jgi:hypothetical protein